LEIPDIRHYSYVEGEISLICRLLKDQDVDEILHRGDTYLFSDGFCRKIFEICKEHASDVGNGHVTMGDVLEILRRRNLLTTDVDAYIRQMYARNIIDLPSLGLVFDELVKQSTHRQLVLQLHKNLVKAQTPGVNVHELVAEAEDDLINLERGGKGKIEVILRDQIVTRRREGLERRMLVKPVYSGWTDFDTLLSHGFAPGKLSIIAGRTSMGKSFFKTNLMLNMCQMGTGVVNVCPEQGFDSEHDRMDAILTGIHLRSLTKLRDMRAEDLAIRGQQLKKVSERMAAEWNYACVPNRDITVTGVQAAIRRAKRAGLTPQVVFIDLFDRLEDVNVASERTANFSVKLNQVSKIGAEENVHMCLLVQVNRGTEQRKEKRPELSDLRDCGNFEQDADLVLLLYREGYYNRDLEDNVLEVAFAKQRDGNAGMTFQFNIMDKNTLSIMPIGVKRRVETGGGQ